MLTHSDRRDFPCTVEGCTFAFKTKGALKRHLRRHTGSGFNNFETHFFIFVQIYFFLVT